MKRIIALAATGVAAGLLVGAANADVFALEGPVKTNEFRQADFKWAVHPRHDYSKTYVVKLFLSQAEFDPVHLGKYKMRDNGKQKVCMNCEQALEVIKGMDALTLGLPKIVYLVGWQYNGHDSKYPAFFEGNRAIARDASGQEVDMIVSLRDGRWGAVEVKLGGGQIDDAARNLLALKGKVDGGSMGEASFLMVLTGTEFAYRRTDGVFVVPLGCLRP